LDRREAVKTDEGVASDKDEDAKTETEEAVSIKQ
jgi:hypothetical protein